MEAVNTKTINLYLDLMPPDFVIKEQTGEIISREKQKEYIVRDWAIIDTTLISQMALIQYERNNF